MPERSTSRRKRRHRARRRRAVAVLSGLAVIATGSAVGIAATSSSGPARRVAIAGLASVTQTVESSGTITSSLKMTPSFAGSGTVGSVDVKVGDSVRAGQVLAQLDTTSLRAAVDSANSTLAKARQQLEADETGQTSISSQVITSAYIVGSPSSSSLSGLIKQIAAAQAAVITAQQRVDSAQSEVDAAQKSVDADVVQNTTLRNTQQTACATSSGSGSASASPSGSPTDTSTACSAAMADYEASADTLSADMATLDGKISAQDGNIKDLQQAITTLDKLVDQLQSAASSTGSGGSGAPSSTVPSGVGKSGAPSGGGMSGAPSGGGMSGAPSGNAGQSGQSGSGQSGSGQNTAQPASAAQLAADQAAIDAAQAQVTAAEQDLEAATLKSPAAGTVAAVGLTAGASSAGQTITIIGTGVQGVDASVPLSQVDLVKVDQSVSVAADGVSTKLHGTVESVGLLSSTSGSSTTFPVTVKLDSNSTHLFDGTGADVVITTGTARRVVTVPNSAIHSAPGGSHTVTVLNGGKTTTVQVTLGVAGSDVTQIKSGLKVGDQVVLADLTQPLPSTSNTSTGTFRFPGLPGGGGGVRNFGAGGSR